MRSRGSNLVLAFLACTIANIGLTLYYFEYIPKRQVEQTTSPKSLVDTTVLAAGIESANRQGVMRDTVILQQVLKVQHQLDMHKTQRIAMCPSCSGGSTHTKFNYTKDDIQ